MNKERFDRIKKQFTDRVMVVVRNKPNQMYKIERQIEKMISAEMPNDEIQKKINILRKYSYKAYVKNNIKLLQKNPKKYHKCLQNII